MQWFRFYSEFARDPKIRTLPVECQLVYILLLCMKCEHLLPNSDKKISFFLQISEKKFQKIKKILMENELITQESDVINWDKRQYTAEQLRQYRHRAKREAAGLPKNRWINKELRDKIFARYQGLCCMCGSAEDLTFAHIIPELKGGGNEENNLQLLCRKCTSKKRDPIDATHNAHNGTHNVPVTVYTDTDTDTDTEKEKIYKKEKYPVVAIFDYWRETMGHGKAMLDDSRRRKIQSAFKRGYTAGQLKDAIDGCKATPWYMGSNADGQVHDGIELIFKNAENIEKFIANFNKPKTATSGRDYAARHTSSSPQSKARQLAEDAVRAITERTGGGEGGS